MDDELWDELLSSPLLLFATLKGLIAASSNAQEAARTKVAHDVALLLVALANLELPEATEG
jgi:hypothetical protein